MVRFSNPSLVLLASLFAPCSIFSQDIVQRMKEEGFKIARAYKYSHADRYDYIVFFESSQFVRPFSCTIDRSGKNAECKQNTNEGIYRLSTENSKAIIDAAERFPGLQKK